MSTTSETPTPRTKTATETIWLRYKAAKDISPELNALALLREFEYFSNRLERELTAAQARIAELEAKQRKASTTFQQAILDSGYAMTERETNIAREFWERGMATKQSTPPPKKVDDLARQIAEALCKHFSVHGRGSRGFVDYRVEPLTVIQFIQPLIAPLQKASKLWEMDAGSFKAAWNNACHDIAELEKRMEQSESQLSAFRDALRGCVEALEWAIAQANAYAVSNKLWEDMEFKADYEKNFARLTTATALLKGDGK